MAENSVTAQSVRVYGSHLENFYSYRDCKLFRLHKLTDMHMHSNKHQPKYKNLGLGTHLFHLDQETGK